MIPKGREITHVCLDEWGEISKDRWSDLIFTYRKKDFLWGDKSEAEIRHAVLALHDDKFPDLKVSVVKEDGLYMIVINGRESKKISNLAIAEARANKVFEEIVQALTADRIEQNSTFGMF